MSEIILRTLLIIITSVAVTLPLTIFLNKKLMGRAQKKVGEAVNEELKKRNLL